ncbi:MAG: prepilin-type N-terminal cleavage/methylation domain-containing protein [Planctomycetota bacterium]
MRNPITATGMVCDRNNSRSPRGNCDPRLHGNSGFTLIELLVVIFIIGLLAAILVPILQGPSETMRTLQTSALIDAIVGPMQAYADRHGDRYPAADPDGLTGTLVAELERLDLHSFSRDQITQVDGRDVLVDGWGEPMHYRPFAYAADRAGAHNPRTYDIWSAGKDGDSSTADDNVGNWR